MRCALVVLVPIGTSCHRDEGPQKDRCALGATSDREARKSIDDFKDQGSAE